MDEIPLQYRDKIKNTISLAQYKRTFEYQKGLTKGKGATAEKELKEIQRVQDRGFDIVKRLFSQAMEGEYSVNESNEQLHAFLKEATMKRIENSKVNAALMR